MGGDRSKDEELSARARALAIRTAPNVNHFWARLMIEEFARFGVCAAVISPGSRSTPLAMAAASHPEVHHYIHYDERGAGFFALGLAQTMYKGALLICTSGSAAANYLPALVEASQSALPLYVLTADRPPELIECGANQAILQENLYGNYTRWHVSLPCPTLEIAPTFLLAQVGYAVAKAMGTPKGPVHINCPFREPLAPTPDHLDLGAALKRLDLWFLMHRPRAETVPSLNMAQVSATEFIQGVLTEAKNPIVVCGALVGISGRVQNDFAIKALPFPVILDPLSFLVEPGELPSNAILHIDALLCSEKFRELFRPDFIIHVGGPLLSKRLNQWIKEADALIVHVSETGQRVNPEHQSTVVFVEDIQEFCDELFLETKNTPQDEWIKLLENLDLLVEEVVDDVILSQEPVSELGVAAIIGRERQGVQSIFAGNSMPIRDIAAVGVQRHSGGAVFANRGASGIDGNIATAAGLAANLLEPLIVVVGDLTLLHDLNSLSLFQHRCAPVVLVVINNDGGGIFHMLPVADEPTPPDQFETLFGTPHGMQFKEIAKAFGFSYAAPKTHADFERIYRNCLSSKKLTLVEVKTNRHANRDAHLHFYTSVGESLDKILMELVPA